MQDIFSEHKLQDVIRNYLMYVNYLTHVSQCLISPPPPIHTGMSTEPKELIEVLFCQDDP